MKDSHKEIFDNGFYIFDELLNEENIDNLFKKMTDARTFSADLFTSENEYNYMQKNHFDCNPTTDFNFLNKFSDDLRFIEENTAIKGLITEFLGDDYEIVIKKLVCGVPKSWLPDWVQKKIDGVNVANLGPYIKQKYRDITYFRGIDFHQDIIDYPKGKTDLDPSTFLTLYVYLHDVGIYDSPLHVIPKSHQFGATLFPHKFDKLTGHNFCYKGDNGQKMVCTDRVLTGKLGYTAIWHNCTIHGTRPMDHESDKFRISLRYIIRKSNSNSQRTLIDELNSKINGDLQPVKTRQDLDSSGKSIIHGKLNIKLD